MLPRIKPRASYAGDPCKLPLLPTSNTATPSGGGPSVGLAVDNANSQASGEEGRKDRRQGGGRGVRGSMGGGLEGSSSGGGEGGAESNGRRRSVVNGSGADNRPPRPSAAEEMVTKEGGGGERERRTVVHVRVTFFSNRKNRYFKQH